MTDVLKLALDRRVELQEEMARLDEFVRMADSLMQGLEPRSRREATAAGHAAEPAEAGTDEDRHPDAHQAPAPQAVAAPGLREVVGPGMTRMNLIRRAVVAGNG